jgi:hypothetical protein
MAEQRLNRVLGAGGIKPAAAGRPEEDRHERRGRLLVGPDQGDGRSGGQSGTGSWKGNWVHGVSIPPLGRIRAQASENACSSLTIGHRLSEDRATTRRSHEAGSRSWWRRKVSRNLRFARFRITAGPTAWVEATKQALRRPILESPGVHQIKNAPQSTRVPLSRTARISACRRRCCAGRRRIVPEFPKLNDSQALTAFAAAGRYCLATATGGHAGPKTDFSGSFFAVRAEGRLHGFSEIKS